MPKECNSESYPLANVYSTYTGYVIFCQNTQRTPDPMLSVGACGVFTVTSKKWSIFHMGIGYGAACILSVELYTLECNVPNPTSLGWKEALQLPKALR